jgi:hypothetical protein
MAFLVAREGGSLLCSKSRDRCADSVRLQSKVVVNGYNGQIAGVDFSHLTRFESRNTSPKIGTLFAAFPSN